MTLDAPDPPDEVHSANERDQALEREQRFPRTPEGNKAVERIRESVGLKKKAKK